MGWNVIVCGDQYNEKLTRWAEQALEDSRLPRPATALGFADEAGNLQAVSVFYNYAVHDIVLTFVAATPRWATKRNIQAVFAYPFRQLGCARMTAITAKSNKRARKLLEGTGFRLEGTHPKGYDGIQATVSYGITRDQAARWLDG